MTDYVLFKFKKIDKTLLKSLVHGEIYFAQPERLNDPFDCSVDIFNALEKAISRSQSTIRTRLEQLRAMNCFIDKVQADLRHVGVCSFSLELINPLMWSHYADGHRGVCLTYAFPESFFYVEPIIGIDQVDYGLNPLSKWFIEEAANINSFEQLSIALIKKVLTVKSLSWGYEKEVRIIRRSDGVQRLDRRHLKQICFGMSTSESDIQLVKELIENCGYEVTLCKIVRDESMDFGLKTVEL
ncbi:hypothetical protein Nhal_1030 [Nitrosococcus halophilus Nc 4]|uniref:DUF2971 domain-containing protein n=1 Tax=Nitrosococcus halophilus (strain Nc4) TaxID=472759 RepID=D5BYZ0_NITHN|nr:DUF2971 domain-containing protein [Nitrosococcus halophilus]ADE14203.1 hypothetical protein Nhal_1030 [Nitrosococcus halophilus Nc 4]